MPEASESAVVVVVVIVVVVVVDHPSLTQHTWSGVLHRCLVN